MRTARKKKPVIQRQEKNPAFIKPANAYAANRIQKQDKEVKNIVSNKNDEKKTGFDFSNIPKESLPVVEAMIAKMKKSTLFSKMYEALDNSGKVYTLKLLETSDIHKDDKAGGGMFSPGTNTITFSLKGLLPELVMAQEMFHAYQYSSGLSKIVVRSSVPSEAKPNEYLKTDIEAEGELATFYMALEVYGAAADNPYYPLFGGVLNFETQTHGTVFEMLSVLTSGDISSKDFKSNYLKFKALFVEQANSPFVGAHDNYKGPVTEVGPMAFEKLVKETEADKMKLQGPRLEDGSYYSK